jgi:hypothetical protein
MPGFATMDAGEDALEEVVEKSGSAWRETAHESLKEPMESEELSETSQARQAGSNLRRFGRCRWSRPNSRAASARSVLGRVLFRPGLVEVRRLYVRLRHELRKHKVACAGKHGERQIP